MPESQPKAAAEMVAEAKGRVENLAPEQLAAELDAGSVTLVDIREDDERTQNGAVPDAVRAPRGMLLYCASGGRSALAADTLQGMGYGNVAHLDGGFKGWKEGGNPVEEVKAG